MKTLETLVVLPEGDGGRFGAIALGSDRVSAIREEHLALRDIAAAACGKRCDALTMGDVTHVNNHVNDRATRGEAALLEGIQLALLTVQTSPPDQAGVELRELVLWVLAANKARTA